MRPLRAKFGKICQWTKKIKGAVVYGWGFFQNRLKKTKIHETLQLRVYLGKLMQSRSARTFHHCLQKRFISVYTRI